MKNKKDYTPSCIDYYMNKINVNCIHISISIVPKIPNSQLSSLNKVLSKQVQKSSPVD